MHPLSIDRIIIHAGQMPVNLRFSFGAPTHFPFVLARIQAGGCEGVGEVLMELPSGLESTLRPLIGADANRLDDLLGKGGEGYGSEAFCATIVQELLSMALHDLVAKDRGVPMHQLMGGAKRVSIPIMPCIFPQSPDDAAAKARDFAGQGFQALKVKIFGDEDGDIAIVRAIRKVFPEGHLQADANSGYKSIDDAPRLLTALREAGLTVIEDPLAGTAQDYAALCRRFEAPFIMLDAHTRGWQALRQVCEARAAHQINLHPCNQGSFSELLQHAALAEAAGIPVAIGGTGYTGIGSFAYAHLAAITGLDAPYGECGGAFDHGMPAPSTVEPLPVKDGVLHLPDRPGHGGILDLAALEPYIDSTLDVH